MHDGRRGHPLILPARLRDALRLADPLASLKDALARLGVIQREITVEDPGVLRDVDRREDLEAGAGEVGKDPLRGT